MSNEIRYMGEAFALIEKLMDDFVALLVRHGKPVASPDEQEKSEMEASLFVELEHFFEPIDSSNDLTDEELEGLSKRLGVDVRDPEQVSQFWQGHIDREKERIRQLGGQL